VSEEQDQGSGQSSESKWDFSGVPENTRDLQPTADWFALPDISLQRMATWADSMGQGTVVTLVVPGGLISGTVESASDYFTGMSRQFQDSIAELGDEKKNGVAKEFAEFFFDEPAKVYADKVEADTEAFKSGKLIEPRYLMARQLHLKDAYYTVPGQTSVPLGRTRVLLSQVAAWSVGGHTFGVDNPWAD
jgi:hypothetical protein